jgi:hypothetical protein
VDIVKFKDTYRIPLYPGKWNVWLVRRTIRDDPSESWVKTSFWNVLNFKWLNKNPSVVPVYTGAIEEKPQSWGGSFDHLSVTVSPAPQDLAKFSPVASISSHAVPVTINGKFEYVLVAFVYRGASQDMAWPVWQTAIGQFFNNWCPEGADWAVDTVYDPPNIPVPPEPSWMDLFAETVSDIFAALAKLVATVAKKVLPSLGDLMGPLTLVAIIGGIYLAIKVVGKAPSLEGIKIGKKPEALPPAQP